MAKKKKVNKKLLMLVTGIVGVVMLAGFVMLVGRHRIPGLRRVFKVDPKPYWDAAESHYKEGRFKEARDDFQRALAVDTTNVDGLVRYGDFLNETARLDPEDSTRAIASWQRALEIKSDCTPAITRILDAYITWADLFGGADVYDQIGIRAKALAALQPQNHRAKAYTHIAVLGKWLSGGVVAENDVDMAVQALDALTPKAPEEPSIPFFAARARLRLASNREAGGDADAARRLRAEARQTMETALAARPDDSAVAFKLFLIVMSTAERRDGSYTPADLDAAQTLLDNAIRLAEKDPRQKSRPEYAEMRIRAAGMLVQRGKNEEAKAAFEALGKDMPDDQRARMALAGYLRFTPEARDRAVKILSTPQANDPTLVGVRSRLKRQWELQRLTDLAWLRMDMLLSLPKEARPASRDEIRKLIDEAATLASSPDRNPLILKLRGRAQLLESTPKILIALDNLRSAHDLFRERKGFDLETANLLISIYAQLQQDGPLRELLQEMTRRYPGDIRPRKLLTHLYYRLGSYAEATRQLAEVERLAPTDPDVPNIRIRLLLAQGEKDKALKMIDEMPTATPQDIRFKAAALAGAGKSETAIVLLQDLCKKELAEGGKKALPSHEQLYYVYMSLDRKADAAALISSVLTVRPDDSNLKLLLMQAEGKSDPDLVNQIMADRTSKITDPVALALEQVRQALTQGKKDEAKKILLDAEKATNGNPIILEFIFNHAIDTGDMQTAQQYLQKLRDINADQTGGLQFTIKLQLARGEYEAALASATELSQKMPHLAGSWVILGQAQHAAGMRQKLQGARDPSTGGFEAAVASFAKALQMQSDNPDALFGIVRCYLELENPSLARVYVDRGLKLRAPHSEPFREFDRLLRENLGEPEKVTAQREKDLKDHPNDMGAHVALAINYVRVAATFEGKDKASRNRFLTQARDVLIKARTQWPEDANLAKHLANVHYTLGNIDDGLKLLQEFAAIEKFKDRPEPHIMLGIYLNRMKGKQLDAEAQLKTALAKSKDNPRVMQLLTDFYLETQQREKAVDLLLRLVGIATNIEAKRVLLEQLVNLARLDQVEPILKAELDKKRNDPTLLSLWGLVRFSRGDHAAAEDSFNAALREDSKHAPSRYYLGLLRREQGDYPAAIREFQTARDLAPGSRDIHLALAEVLVVRNQLDDAATEMNTALNLAPKDRRLRQRVIDIYVELERWTRVRQLIDEAKADPDLNRDPAWLRSEARMHLGRKELKEAESVAVAAYEMDRSDEQSIRLILDIHMRMKAYDRIIQVTDPVVKDSDRGKPYWLYMIRGQAQKARGQPEKVVSAEFENALTALDRAQDDPGSEVLAQEIAKALGLPAAAALLESRVSPRWSIQLVRVYATQGKWDQANKLMDNLLSPAVQQKLTDGQKLLAANMAVSTYTMGALRYPEMSDKAIRACQLYLDECKRLRLPASERMIALNNLATLVLEQPTNPNLAQALSYSTQAVDIMTKMGRTIPAIIDTHGWALVLNGKIDEGIEQFLLAANQPNAPVDVYYHLGQAYLRKSDPDRAFPPLKKAMDMAKAFKDKGEPLDRSMEERIEKAYKAAEVAKRPSAGNTP